VFVATVGTFGDEWRCFPELYQVHKRIFAWYFEGAPVHCKWSRGLDAGCGMYRWLYFAARAGGDIRGMEVSRANVASRARYRACGFSAGGPTLAHLLTGRLLPARGWA
jgi:hypothetical protein